MSQENAANIEVNETAAESKLTADYILDKIERIDNDMQYLYDAIKAIGEIPSGTDAGPMGDVSGMEKAKALADIVRCRETTKQKLLDFYTGLLDDLRKQDRNHKKDALEILRAAVESDSDDKNSLVEQVNYALDAVRHIDN
nr:hypothetical protein [Clostridia bacterium]